MTKVIIGGWGNTGTRIICELLHHKGFKLPYTRNDMYDYWGLDFIKVFKKGWLSGNYSALYDMVDKDLIKSQGNVAIKHGHFILKIKELHELYPNVKFVICIRDPLDMYRKTDPNYHEFGTAHHETPHLGKRYETIKLWYDSLHSIPKESYHIVRLEDLLFDTNNTITELFEFVGVDSNITDKVSKVIKGPSKTIGMGRDRISDYKKYHTLWPAIQEFRNSFGYLGEEDLELGKINNIQKDEKPMVEIKENGNKIINYKPKNNVIYDNPKIIEKIENISPPIEKTKNIKPPSPPIEKTKNIKPKNTPVIPINNKPKKKKEIGKTILFTGLSGSGKSTTAQYLKEKIEKFTKVFILDGDILRQGLCSDLGFSNEDREENIRRVGHLCVLLNQMGYTVLATFIAPFQKSRDFIRNLHIKNNLIFYECWMSTSIDVCQKQDVKGLYKKANNGEIKNFTGITSPYEEPTMPDFILDQTTTLEHNCNTIIKKIENQNIIHLTKLDMEWVQIISEGWCEPLKGFMREDDFLTCIHFQHIVRKGVVYPVGLPIVLPCPEKMEGQVELFYEGKKVATLLNAQSYDWNKTEMINRVWGVDDDRHPYIKIIKNNNNKYLIGGEIQMCIDRVRWDDGLDEYRLTPSEIKKKIRKMTNVEKVVAFQTRNPLHNGHIYMIKNTLSKINKSVLLLHPLGGTTKDDDVPLKIRMEQYKTLNLDNCILAIFPSPMMYAGPREAVWHARAREIAGADFIIAGRDMAGVLDLYDYTHAKRLLGLNQLLKIEPLQFESISYSKSQQKMVPFDPENKEDFINISGTKMRQMAKEGKSLPDGFMDPRGWEVLKKYYSSLQN